MQQTEQIPNNPPGKGVKNTTTSNHPSTREQCTTNFDLTLIFYLTAQYNKSNIFQVCYGQARACGDDNKDVVN